MSSTLNTPLKFDDSHISIVEELNDTLIEAITNLHNGTDLRTYTEVIAEVGKLCTTPEELIGSCFFYGMSIGNS